MEVGSYRLKSGRKICLRQLHVQVALLGYWEGEPERIREHVLKELPKTVEKHFSPKYKFVLLHEPPCPAPRYLFLAEFLSYKPVHVEFTHSILVVGWYGDVLPRDLHAYLEEQMDSIDWDKWALDADW